LIQSNRKNTGKTYWGCVKYCSNECTARIITVFYVTQGMLVFVKEPEPDHAANQEKCVAERKIFTIKPKVEESLKIGSHKT